MKHFPIRFKVGDRVAATANATPSRIVDAEGVIVAVTADTDYVTYSVAFDNAEALNLDIPFPMFDQGPNTDGGPELEPARLLDFSKPGGSTIIRASERVLKDDGSREQYPLYDGLFAYFPAALCEVARWSVVGNDKHNPGQKLHWARDKSTDHENKILRHLLDARQVDKDGFVEAVALVWRSLALCQTILEERGWAEGPNARRNGAAS